MQGKIYGCMEVLSTLKATFLVQTSFHFDLLFTLSFFQENLVVLAFFYIFPFIHINL